MTIANTPTSEGPTPPKRWSRRGKIGTAIAVSVALIGVGIGVWAVTSSGGSGEKTPAAARTPARNSYVEGTLSLHIASYAKPGKATYTLTLDDFDCAENATRKTETVALDADVKLGFGSVGSGRCFTSATWVRWKVSVAADVPIYRPSQWKLDGTLTLKQARAGDSYFFECGDFGRSAGSARCYLGPNPSDRVWVKLD